MAGNSSGHQGQPNNQQNPQGMTSQGRQGFSNQGSGQSHNGFGQPQGGNYGSGQGNSQGPSGFHPDFNSGSNQNPGNQFGPPGNMGGYNGGSQGNYGYNGSFPGQYNPSNGSNRGFNTQMGNQSDGFNSNYQGYHNNNGPGQAYNPQMGNQFDHFNRSNNFQGNQGFNQGYNRQMGNQFDSTPNGFDNYGQNNPQGMNNFSQNNPQGMNNYGQNNPQGMNNYGQNNPQGMNNHGQNNPQGMNNHGQNNPQGMNSNFDHGPNPSMGNQFNDSNNASSNGQNTLQGNQPSGPNHRPNNDSNNLQGNQPSGIDADVNTNDRNNLQGIQPSSSNADLNTDGQNNLEGSQPSISSADINAKFDQMKLFVEQSLQKRESEYEQNIRAFKEFEAAKAKIEADAKVELEAYKAKIEADAKAELEAAKAKFEADAKAKAAATVANQAKAMDNNNAVQNKPHRGPAASGQPQTQGGKPATNSGPPGQGSFPGLRPTEKPDLGEPRHVVAALQPKTTSKENPTGDHPTARLTTKYLDIFDDPTAQIPLGKDDMVPFFIGYGWPEQGVLPFWVYGAQKWFNSGLCKMMFAREGCFNPSCKCNHALPPTEVFLWYLRASLDDPEPTKAAKKLRVFLQGNIRVWESNRRKPKAHSTEPTEPPSVKVYRSKPRQSDGMTKPNQGYQGDIEVRETQGTRKGMNASAWGPGLQTASAAVGDLSDAESDANDDATPGVVPQGDSTNSSAQSREDALRARYPPPTGEKPGHYQKKSAPQSYVPGRAPPRQRRNPAEHAQNSHLFENFEVHLKKQDNADGVTNAESQAQEDERIARGETLHNITENGKPVTYQEPNKGKVQADTANAETRENTHVEDGNSVENETQEVKDETEKVKDEAEKVKGEAEKVKGEAEKVKDEAEKVKDEAEKVDEAAEEGEEKVDG